ncbi:hypothetical protein Tdes44962_MAKER10481 [Teratosphaeria destructans]|uniref:Uncharacterized protein n=1 Tax=Teratosphaeria destructans TaxID=418781 RepID=A0A9W7T1D4_9PEZI|nr:hypothetical protein Tdes44962_MAKER10481 [Teratosphaeria destructans]
MSGSVPGAPWSVDDPDVAAAAGGGGARDAEFQGVEGALVGVLDVVDELGEAVGGAGRDGHGGRWTSATQWRGGPSRPGRGAWCLVPGGVWFSGSLAGGGFIMRGPGRSAGTSAWGLGPDPFRRGEF